MREIKFRFYPKNPVANFHGENVQKMWQAEVIDLDAREITNGSDVFNLDEVNVMQYTGLKDKNGKEIYEGDILQYCEKNKQIYIVKYGSYNRNDGLKNIAPQLIGASFYLEGIDMTISPVYTYNDHTFLYPVSLDFPSFENYNELWGLKIIGNIYENPELLNK